MKLLSGLIISTVSVSGLFGTLASAQPQVSPMNRRPAPIQACPVEKWCEGINLYVRGQNCQITSYGYSSSCEIKTCRVDFYCEGTTMVFTDQTCAVSRHANHESCRSTFGFGF